MELEEVYPNDTISYIKRRIATRYKGNSLLPLNLFFGERELKENNKTLSYYKVNDQQSISFQVKATTTSNMVEEIQPSTLIFETLQQKFKSLGLKPNVTTSINSLQKIQ